ncbi:alpha/beta fold hydrolase [Streptacidiphilus jiangxiensis]|uniref:Pimeloyl-ACP methyl ester carboxylesterase n=1 Tax=Streptacidiphilus jiangxiensis TaxID=235985 RepID=A0A1H7KGI1_STRJI|nr:alpha/beta fold hydrolase [Streptacidiphilus jiangxiensis]SEK85961.1 Pimeloyl-ACP methyl ester carboxylesterase [Streptacidiphilus jiangxiensis]
MIDGAREHRVVTDDGVELAVVEAGDPLRPTLWFLHGYPDCRDVWAPVMDRLRDRYHVVAYDVRGTGRSTAPPSADGRDGYTLERLEEDFLTVLDALAPYGPVHLVGHDWGSVQGWEFATSPRLQGGLASFTSISGPCLDHVALWARTRLRRRTSADLRALLDQAVRSWYITAFRLPRLPEALWRGPLAHGGWAALWRALERTRVPGHPAPTLARDAVAGLWLYRANTRRRAREPRPDRVARVPVQLVVPERDPFLGPRLYDDLDRWTPVLRRRTVDAGHWLPLTRPALVADLIAEFVDAVRVGSIPSVGRDHLVDPSPALGRGHPHPAL